MIRRSWIVFLHAALLSAESVAIELLNTSVGLAPMAVAGNSIAIAGAGLVAYSALTEKAELLKVFRAWKLLLPASGLLAVGIYFWYDSVTNVGASKEGLLAGPLEVVVILALAGVVLKEKLGRSQKLGAGIALAGFFVAIASAQDIQFALTIGDAEAIISAVCFATGVIIVTKLTKTHSSLSITGGSLLISGAVLAAVLWSNPPAIGPADWPYIAAFSALPLSAALAYVLGLSRIGASMTSVIGSFSILLTIVFQLALFALGVDVILPSNVALAVAGGVLGVLGIYLIHRGH